MWPARRTIRRKAAQDLRNGARRVVFLTGYIRSVLAGTRHMLFICRELRAASRRSSATGWRTSLPLWPHPERLDLTATQQNLFTCRELKTRPLVGCRGRLSSSSVKSGTF
uniref:(northern house mosquito) hypothetical protein n=1 Tax=Culex pipiens TaxID=7175 RepID=A0A8D8FGG9_CULPI